MTPYEPRFEVGARVEIADRAALEMFMRTWEYHNPLKPEQLAYAKQNATIEKVGIYHGGDVLYQLLDIPGIWHEGCLRGTGEQTE